MPNQFISSQEGDLENYFVSEYWLIDQWVGDTLWTWGQNSYGKLGTNDTIDRPTPVTTFAGGSSWIQVSAGRDHASAVKTDGTLWVWGLNDNSQLGTNDTTNRVTPVTTFATFANGNNWKQVSCGNLYTTAIKTNGTLWVWGLNDTGQLGTNDTINRLTPVTTFAGGGNWKQVSSGNGHTTAIKADGTLWVWGLNDSGQLGINITGNKLTPVSILSGGTNWKQVSSGNRYTAAVKTDGTLWVWGRNFSGQLGTNDTDTKVLPVTTFAGGNNWKQVFCSDIHTSAIKTDGTLWICGRNDLGQLGVNDTTNRLTPVTTFAGGNNWKQASLGVFFSSAIKTDGTLWNWGAGSSYALGINDTINRLTPVTTFAGGSNWKQVSSHDAQTYAVTSGTDPTLFIT